MAHFELDKGNGSDSIYGLGIKRIVDVAMRLISKQVLLFSYACRVGLLVMKRALAFYNHLENNQVACPRLISPILNYKKTHT